MTADVSICPVYLCFPVVQKRSLPQGAHRYTEESEHLTIRSNYSLTRSRFCQCDQRNQAIPPISKTPMMASN